MTIPGKLMLLLSSFIFRFISSFTISFPLHDFRGPLDFFAFVLLLLLLYHSPRFLCSTLCSTHKDSVKEQRIYVNNADCFLG